MVMKEHGTQFDGMDGFGTVIEVCGTEEQTLFVSRVS